MSKVQCFTLNPLSCALKLLSIAPFLLVGELAHGRVLVPGEVLSIDGTTAADNYVLNGASTLNANGAQTRDITVNKSTLNLNGTAVQATSANGVMLNSGRANIAGSAISSDRVGLAVSRDPAGTLGSTATVSDSSISGVTAGVAVSGLSDLTLVRSTVTGTGANAAGLRMFGGSATATGSTISGNSSGIFLGADNLVNAPVTLNLDSTNVSGLNGSAILVDTLGIGPVQANIAVLNGSTLSASNGILMDVRRGAEGNLRVGNSTLVGDIVADGTSTANVTLEQSASLTGRLQNVNTLAVNSGASWNMVEDGTVKNLSLNGGNIQFGSGQVFFRRVPDVQYAAVAL